MNPSRRFLFGAVAGAALCPSAMMSKPGLTYKGLTLVYDDFTQVVGRPQITVFAWSGTDYRVRFASPLSPSSYSGFGWSTP